MSTVLIIIDENIYLSQKYQAFSLLTTLSNQADCICLQPELCLKLDCW